MATKFFLCLILIASPSYLFAQRISVIAGGPGDGRLATEVDISTAGIAVGGDGTIYLISSSYNSIRKIDPVTGIISRYAGSGAWGDGIIGADALVSPLGSVQSLAIGPEGWLYFVEGATIKKIDGSGKLQLVAGLGTLGYAGDGGLATQAKFGTLTSITFDNNGNLYVGDFGNNRVRKIDQATGIVTTIAGNGSVGSTGNGGLAMNASLTINEIAMDGNSNLFILGFTSNDVRKIDLSTGIITATAGDGTVGFTGDGGPASGARLAGPSDIKISNGILYISDTGNSRIRQIDLSSGIISTIAGNGTAGSNGDGGPALNAQIRPSRLAFDPGGNLIFSEYRAKIRKITGTTISTVAGNPFNGDGNLASLASVGQPFGIAKAANGDIYFADQQNNRIRKIDHATATISTIAGNGSQGYSGDGGLAINASLAYPRAVAIDASGNILFSEYFNGTVRKVDVTTGIISTIAGTGTPGDSGSGGLATSAQIDQVNGIAIDGTGNIFLTNFFYNKIKRIDHATQVITTIAGTGTGGFSGDGGQAVNANIFGPQGITIGPDGNIYFCDLINHRIRKIDQNGIITTLAGNPAGPPVSDGAYANAASVPGPASLFFDSHGDLFVGAFYHIYRINMISGQIFYVAGAVNTGGGLSGDGGAAMDATVRQPGELFVETNGDITFTDPDVNVIRKITARTLTQTITFNSLDSHAFGDQPFPITSSIASSSASIPLTFSSSNTAVATVAGNVITITGIGSTNITASQQGNTDYLPASPVVQSLVVSKGVPGVVITSANSGSVNTTITLAVDTKGSTGNVAYSVANSSGTASLTGNVLRLNSKGTVTVTASVAGDAFFQSASVQQVVTIGNSLPGINFTNPLTGDATNTIVLSVNSSSTGVVTFSKQNLTGKANLSGSVLSLVSPGQIRITASIAATASYSAATISQIFTINNANGTPVSLSAKLFGTTLGGGSGGGGTLYQLNGDFTGYTALKEFSADLSGSSPFNNDLTEAPDGKLYGVLPSGGTHNSGVLYSIVPSNGTYSVLYNFTSAEGLPSGNLTLGSDGNFYGFTSTGGDNNHGVLFQYDYVNHLYSRKKNFDGTTGYSPGTGLTEISGILYGVMNADDVNGGGTIFSYKLSDESFSVLQNLTSGDPTGSGPSGYLTLAPNNKLYGFNSYDGQNGSGTIFEFDISSGTYTSKVDLDYSTTGATPMGGLALAPNGKLYGVLSIGSPGGAGSIVEYTPGSTSCVRKYEFLSPQIGSPAGGLRLSNGKFYGLASSNDGSIFSSTVYEYTPGLTSVLERSDFNGHNDIQPSGMLALASNGKMYGSTILGETRQAGGLFEFDPATFALNEIKGFAQTQDGISPGPHLVISDTKLIGIASGSSASSAVIYEYDLLNGVYSKPAELTGLPANRIVTMVSHPNGNIYILANAGGSLSDHGSIVEYNPIGHQVTVAYTFTVNDPYPTFIAASHVTGKIYGTALGTSNSIFEFDPVTKAFVTKRVLDASADGSNPSGLIEGPDQKLYGVCPFGGTNSVGTIFQYDPRLNQFVKLADFSTASGRRPKGIPMFAPDGKIYGTTRFGGQYGLGTLYQLDIAAKVLTKKQDLDHQTDDTFGALAFSVGPSGKLLGSYRDGGSSSNGNLFEYNQGNNTIVPKLEFTGTNGSNPSSNIIVIKNEQSIVFNAIDDKTIGTSPFPINPTATSGLPVTLTSSDPSVATVTGNTVTIVGVGNVIITATQAGDQNFNPAPGVAQSFTVVKATQTIAFSDISTKTFGPGTFALAATATSGLPVTYSTTSDKVTIAATTVTMVKAGRVSINADQGGNASYNAAETVVKSFCINPAKPTITATGLTTSSPLLTSSGDAGNQWFRDGVAISGAINKTYNASTAGVYTLKISADDCISETSDPVAVVATGLEGDNVISFTLYPNPARDEITLTLTSGANDETFLLMTDMLGHVTYSGRFKGGIQTIDIRSLMPGLYVVRTSGTQGNVVKTFIKVP